VAVVIRHCHGTVRGSELADNMFLPVFRNVPLLLSAKPRLGRALTPKQVSDPRTAKTQPIWIKFCTHLLLYGIHLWADLHRDRCVGGSRPNQNDYKCFLILVTHPKSYIKTTRRRDFGGKLSKVEVRTGAIVKDSRTL